MLHFKLYVYAITFILGFLVCLPNAQAADDITINGITFYKDGKPWIAKGVHVGAFARPQYISSAPKWMNDSGAKLRDTWNTAEVSAIKNVFGANTIRFDVSQPALDPQSPIYDAHYLTDVLTAVKQARANGFIVIVVVNSQSPSGVMNLPGMPGDSTARAWQTLAPALMNDRGILFELFNEPTESNSPQAQQDWAQAMQLSINAVRGTGARNIILLDGLYWARSTNGLFLLVHDSIPNRMALAVHPYLVSHTFFANSKQWHDQFGASAAQYPMIVTEWDATSNNGCIGPDLPDVALSMARYLESLHLGLIGWGIDTSKPTLVKDHVSFTPTDYSAFKDCKDGSISGGGKLLVNYPNN